MQIKSNLSSANSLKKKLNFLQKNSKELKFTLLTEEDPLKAN